MRKIKLSGLLIIIGILSFSLTACGNTGDADSNFNAKAESEEEADANTTADGEITIRVGVCSGDQNHYLKIVDEHTGLFKEKGIDLQISEFAAGINTIDAITTGQLDIGLFADYAGVNRIGNTVGNTELRAFANSNISTSYRLYVNPDVIKSGDDLQEATLISMAGVVFEYDYGKLFEAYDIDKDQVKIVNVTSVQEALALASTGEGDAFWSTPQTDAMFEEYGWEPFVGIADIDATMYTYLVANQSYLEEHHDDVVEFLKISEEGFQYISDNIEEVSEWVSEDTGLDKALVISGWNSSEHAYAFSQEAYEDLVKVKDWCYENGNFDTDYDVADYVNTNALAEAFPDRVTWEAD